MLFANIELASRIERVECSLLTDCAAAIATARPGDEPYVQAIGGGIAMLAADQSPFNKLAGLGFEAFDEHQLEAIEQHFDSKGVALQVELSCLADPSIGATLTRRGYVLQGFENILGRELPTETSSEPPPGVRVEVSDPDDLPRWRDVVVTGFATPDEGGMPAHESFPREAIERDVTDMSSARGFARYLALRDGEPAGAASMRIFDGIAQLCGATTLPDHRRRGIQTAMLGRRLADASREGCDIAVVGTLPGSKSQQNVQRQGFELLYTRAILVRPGPGD